MNALKRIKFNIIGMVYKTVNAVSKTTQPGFR